MKKLSLVLVCCILLCAFNLTVIAMETQEYPDVVPDEILLYTEFVLDLTPYEGEGPFEFYGIPIVSIEHSSGFMTPEEELEMFKFVAYKITVVSGVDIYESIDILNTYEGIEATTNGYGWDDDIWVDNNIIPTGDVNGDDTVDTFDCLIVKSIHFDKYEATADELSRADVNKDGTIDLFDYMEIKAMCFE